MKTLLFIGPLYLTLLYVQIPSTVTATRIFCQAHAVSAGDPATLTCYFPEDLSHSGKSIGVARRDWMSGSRARFLLGCIWVGEKLRCGVRDGFQLITQQVTYDVTFRISSHEPGTFLCDYFPEDQAVTVEACNLTLKGSPPRTVTPSRPDSPTDITERSEGRSEDGDPLAGVTVLSVIIAVVVTLLIVLLCLRRSRRSSFCLLQKHSRGESQTKFGMKEIESRRSASPLVQKHGKGESQTELATKEIQPAGNVLVGEPKSTKGKARCK